MSLPDGIIAYQGEAMLLQWSGSTSRTGPKLILQLPDDDALEHFRAATVAKGGKAGQRYAIVVVEVADDETPVNQQTRQQPERPKGGPVSRDAAGFCNSESFRRYVSWEYSWDVLATAPEAAEYLRELCGIGSRAELDHSPDAREAYEHLKREVLAWSVRDSQTWENES